MVIILEWYSYVVAIILLISSVVSPWLVNKENNKHQLSLKKLDLYEISKRKALADFIDSAEEYLLNIHVIEQSVKYYASMNKLFLYFSNLDLTLFVPFEKACKEENLSIATVELSKISQALSKQVSKE